MNNSDPTTLLGAAVAEVWALQQENAKLREALITIANIVDGGDYCQAVAREALS
jgi:hypothetical protein